MTREQQDRTRKLAKWAAGHDAMDERPRTTVRGQWWVGELSPNLGIVDGHGMIDVDGEMARVFVRTYMGARV